MKKRYLRARLVALALTVTMLVSAGPAFAAEAVQIKVDGKTLTSDVAPVIENNRTLVPFRVCAEALGAEVDWDRTDNSVTMVKGSNVVRLVIGSANAYINSELNQLDVPAQVKDNRTLVPLRFVGEALDCTVNWVQASNAVEISTGSGSVIVDDGRPYANLLTTDEAAAYINQLLNSINYTRENKGLNRLLLSGELSEMAQSHSEDMAANLFLNSSSPTNGNLVTRAKRYQLLTPGENVARVNLKNDGDITEAVLNWLKYDTSLANVLQASAGYVGLGVASDKYDKDVIYVTAEFLASDAYFTNSLSANVSVPELTLRGYSTKAADEIILYTMSTGNYYSERTAYPIEVVDGRFSLTITLPQQGTFKAQIGNSIIQVIYS